ncbi:MAG: SEC-C metal-binding domain-containing protein, partial [Eubacteriales bacterium]|nr:SEC-C metal-binding domain-containing protein [Eubacteriales bacterium]
MALKIGRNDPCWCGSGKKYKKCHEAFDVKYEQFRQKRVPILDHDLIKTPEQIEKIKESCRINIA